MSIMAATHRVSPRFTTPRAFYSNLVHFAYSSSRKETLPAKDESWQQLLLQRSTRAFDLLPCPGLQQSQAHPEGREGTSPLFLLTPGRRPLRRLMAPN